MLLRLLLVSLMTSVLDGQSLGGPTHGKKVVCYWARKAYYNPVQGQPRFQLETLDPSLCTHIVYYNAYYDDDKNVITTFDPNLDFKKDNGKGNFLGVTGLKKLYPHLKILIAIGDFNNGPTAFSKMAADAEMRKVFVRNAKRFLNHFGFDGLDINWYYPTWNGGAPHDRQNYVRLAKEISESFKPRGFLLTATIGTATDKYILDTTYDLESLSRYLNLVHMISGNYHHAGEGVFGASAPLRGVNGDDDRSVEFSVDYVLSSGVPPHKLVLGLAFQGRTFVLKNQQVTDIVFGDTSTKNAGFKGPYSGVPGYMDYIEICLALSNSSSGWSYHWDDNSATPYIREQGRAVSFDNGRSIAAKIKLAVDKGFGGIFIWTINADDYLAICSPESHHESEAYTDFTQRLRQITDDVALEDAMQTLNFPDESFVDANRVGPSYVMSNGKLKLLLPPTGNKVRYKLTHIVNDVTALAIQEKRILDEMKRIKTENRITAVVPNLSVTEMVETSKPPKVFPSDFQL